MVETTENGWTDNGTGLDWFKHLDKRCIADKGRIGMLILDGHKSHISAGFDNYCEINKIVLICLPPHSFHLTQPLDVGCFGPLKRAYGDQINKFFTMSLNHITKDDFLVTFRAAYFKAITADNIKGGFRGTGLIPHDPEAILSKLNIKLRIPTPTLIQYEEQWTSQTPCNPKEAISQSRLVRDKIARHQPSLPTFILAAPGSIAKGLAMIAHSYTLLEEENRSLRAADKALSKHRSAKKTHNSDGERLI